jgi:protein-arginine kinase activator protein McsA
LGLKIQDSLAKFRVQFIDSNGKKAANNCETCVNELGAYFEIVNYDSNENQKQEASNLNLDNNDSNKTKDTSNRLEIKDLIKVKPYIII